MKFFLDTANLDQIREAANWGILDGVTTNPTLISKENRSLGELVPEICKLIDGPVNVEAISTKENEIVEEARKLSKIHPNIVVKIPLTDEGLKAVKKLSKEGVKTNVTLVFSANQALLAAMHNGKRQMDQVPRFGTPAFKPNRQYVREMKRFGVLKQDFNLDREPINIFETDQRYWKLFWYEPRNEKKWAYIE